MNDIDFDGWIAAIASYNEFDDERFRSLVDELAEMIRPYGPEAAEILIDVLERPPALPPSMEEDFSEETWIASCGAAAIAVLEACGDDAVEALLAIVVGHAPGPDDLAEAALVRLAKSGVATADIVRRLAADIDVLYFDAAELDKFVEIGYVTPELLDKLREILDGHVSGVAGVDDDTILALVDALVALAREEAAPYVPILREWVLTGISYGPNDLDYTSSEAPILEWRAIRAALILHRLYPCEIPIREALIYWSETHVNDEIRAMIREGLSGNSEL
jgi:hypothetical protein